METTQELAWLQFNRRVLEQTKRRDFPVLEKLRFLAIWSSNLDEFFAARISRFFLEGRCSEAYHRVLAEACAQTDAAARCYEDFLPELSRLGIRILSTAELTREEKHYVGAFLAKEVAPRTDVIRADEVRRAGPRHVTSIAPAPKSPAPPPGSHPEPGTAATRR